MSFTVVISVKPGDINCMLLQGLVGWNPNLGDGTLTLLQWRQRHFSFFISIFSKVRVFLFWRTET
jgi:hypothetical protein